MALVDENGAGKSTMMKVLTGIYTKDAGSLLWLGQETRFLGPKCSQEAGIGIIHVTEPYPSAQYCREYFSWSRVC